MKKLVIFAEGVFLQHLLQLLSSNQLGFLKEIQENRINLSVGVRFTFEILNYSSHVQSQISNLDAQMKLLNICNQVQSTMKVY